MHDYSFGLRAASVPEINNQLFRKINKQLSTSLTMHALSQLSFVFYTLHSWYIMNVAFGPLQISMHPSGFLQQTMVAEMCTVSTYSFWVMSRCSNGFTSCICCNIWLVPFESSLGSWMGVLVFLSMQYLASCVPYMLLWIF